MAIDRAAILRQAEKLLRQGRLDQAIAEYVRIVEEQPRDWNTTNILGDLYVRAGRSDKAVDQFVRIADGLNDEGFLPKAGALYKKILKLKPDHEHALVQSAEIAASQGLLADARASLRALSEMRRARGDQRGVAQVLIRLGSLDPADFDARRAAARARVDVKDTAGALRDLKEIAAELADLGREAEAIDVLHEAAAIDPDDEEIRTRLDVRLATGNPGRTGESTASPQQLKDIAARLAAEGRIDESIVTLAEASRLDPQDAALKTQLARAFLDRADRASAAEYLTVETAGDDPQLLLVVAEMQLRAGDVDAGLALVRQVLERDVNRRQDVALLGWTVSEQSPEVGYQLVEIAADAAVRERDWASAAAGLQEFVTRVPNQVAALMRLVEVCVDGGLEATMYSAQAQLADAYLAAGSAAEARFLAEDLVAREPWDRANIERFRRALELMGEPDPDGVIADRLSGQSPFMSTDLSLAASDLPPFVDELPGTTEAPEPDTRAAEPPASGARTRATGAPTPAAGAVNLDTLLDEIEGD